MKNNLSLHEKQLISYLESSERILGAARKKIATVKKGENKIKTAKEWPHAAPLATFAEFI